jgi:hypothetical protein|tara:strand:- start:189 stop:386 length:198 start_codon:yes stop_codon:yes gene_type:complete
MLFSPKPEPGLSCKGDQAYFAALAATIGEPTTQGAPTQGAPLADGIAEGQAADAARSLALQQMEA